MNSDYCFFSPQFMHQGERLSHMMRYIYVQGRRRLRNFVAAQ